MSDKTNLFGGFDAISSMLVRNDDRGTEEIAKFKDDADDDAVVIDNIDDDDVTPGKKVKKPKVEVDDPDLEDIKPPKVKTPKVEEDSEEEEEETEEEEEEDSEELNEYEESVSKYFADDLAKKLDIDLPEDFEAKKLEDVISLMVDVIKENSKPTFANEEIESLNKFVEDGGNLKDYYKDIIVGTIDIDNIDLESEHDQKAILREHLSNANYKKDRIEKAIERYEDAGVLKDEAEEALDLVKEARDKKAKKLLAEQEKFSLDQQKAKQAFVDTVYNTVEQSKSILGVEVSKDQKKEVLDYIFKQDRNGLSQMQKDLQDPKAQVENLIERAFLKKFSNKLITESKKQGANDAYKDVRNKLKAGKGKSSAGGNTSFGRASSSPLSDLSSLLLNK
jgi:hypothetical protein